MKFDTKIAIVLSDTLATWEKLNATAFLTSGIAASAQVVGEPYVDADGIEYLPMIGQPVMVFETDDGGVRNVFQRARARELATTLFTRELFSTGHDRANRAAVAAVPTSELKPVGIGIYGPRSPVDKCLKGVELHA